MATLGTVYRLYTLQTLGSHHHGNIFLMIDTYEGLRSLLIKAGPMAAMCIAPGRQLVMHGDLHGFVRGSHLYVFVLRCLQQGSSFLICKNCA